MNLTLKIWRQANADAKGKIETYQISEVSPDMSFLEMMDVLNEELIEKGIDPVAFDHDCREGICGMCSMFINGEAHGPDRLVTTCQLHMRKFKDGDTITIEPFRAQAFPVIKDVYERPGNTFERIVVPFTDGVKSLNVVTNLKDAYDSKGKNLIEDFERNITLALIDDAWKVHLRKMDELKQSVQLAVHEQKDPLLIYKFEAFELFKSMLNKLNKEVLSFLIKGSLPSQSSSTIQEAKRPRSKQKLNISKDEVLNTEEMAQRNRQVGAGASQPQRQIIETITREQPRIGRNEKVTIKNVTSGETKTVKFKQAEPLIKQGSWVISS